ncbi:MAG: serine hydrolase domain-containing protein [Pseudoxanthomonas sp.]
MLTEITPSEAGMDAAALARLDASVQADIDAGKHFGASLLVARGGKIVHRANLGTVAPNRPAASDDRYLLMSMSKAYTAVLALRAIEQGLFTLETKVADLMPGFGIKGKQDATMRQLLCHTAGLPTALVSPPLPLTAVGQLKRLADAACKLDVVYPPGTRCAYTSGNGHDLVGQIVVNTDPKRRSFRQIAHDEIFAPLGMCNSSFGLAVDHPKRVPVTWAPASVEPTSDIISTVFNQSLVADSEFPSAGAYSDVDDVFRFIEALIGRDPNGVQLLSPEMFALARQNASGDLRLEAIMPKNKPAMALQMLRTAGLFKFLKVAKAVRGGQAAEDFKKEAPQPANFTLLGGYTRGVGDYHNPAGRTATPSALAAVGGASTGWMVDTERDLTFIFLSAGFMEGLAHPRRLERLADLAIAAIKD